MFFLKNVLLKKLFFFKIVLLKIARKTKNLRILRGKKSQNVIFCVQNFLQNLLFKNIFFFKIVLFKIFFSSNLTRRKIFNSKSGAS